MQRVTLFFTIGGVDEKAYENGWQEYRERFEEYRDKVRLKGPGGVISTELDHDMKKIMPGEDFFPAEEISIPANIEEREYEVQFGIVKPGEDKPCVKMANKDRDPQGWLTAGTVKVRSKD